MSLEEDDDVQSFYDAQSMADAFELARERAWEWELDDGGAVAFDWRRRAGLFTPAQLHSISSIIPAPDATTPDENNAEEDEEVSRDSRHTTPPATPATPHHHRVVVGKRESWSQRHLAASETRRESQTTQGLSKNEDTLAALTRHRSSTSGGEYAVARGDGTSLMSAPPAHARHTRSKTFSSSATAPGYDNATIRPQSARKDGVMERVERTRAEDLFLELADDQAAEEGDQERTRLARHGSQASKRLPFASKRRSLPAESGAPLSPERRPKSSGHVLGNKATSRISNPLDLQTHIENSRETSDRLSVLADDVASVSSRSMTGVSKRYAMAPERTSSLAEQFRSPEMLPYGRRRPSFGVASRQGPKLRPSQLAQQMQDSHSESPAEGSEPKRSLPDSASVDSDTADTVWDELDDLKSRIKKLELTGKLPPTSGEAVSVEQGERERPRTATTAPTTIDSSPKNEKPEKHENKAQQQVSSRSPDEAMDYVVGGPDAANIHPNLHSALARAKALLNPSLYRSLEATATDALQLAVMTGSAGPQGTALTAAAIINGVTVSDRHVRRKADTMCRNLTDLVLALCDGKSEAPSIISSPITLNTSTRVSPLLRHSRSSLSPSGDISRNTLRPMSRLEARRTSILGSQASSYLGSSPIESGEDMSASEQESTKSYPRIQEPRASLGRPASRLQAARQRRFENVDGDEDPTLRPPSRAMTDIGRATNHSTKEYSTPQRSPSLRESLAVRRVSSSNREVPRAPSLLSDSGRRRTFDPSTPPVLEEVDFGEEYQPSSASSQSKRRIMSYGPYAARSSVPTRSASLHQSRQVLVD